MTLETYKPCKYCESVCKNGNGLYDRTIGEALVDEKAGEICGVPMYLYIRLFGNRMQTTFGEEAGGIDLGETKIKYCPMCGRRLDTEEEIEEFVDRQYKEKQ